MFRSSSIIAALLLCQMLGTNSQQENSQNVVKSNNAFSTSLYRALTSEEGNLVVSPFSVHTVMSMAWLGAGGDTAQQLQSSLHLPANRSHVESGFNSLLHSLRSSETITLDVANKLYVQRGFGIKDTYRQTAVDNFRSDVEEVNFRNESEAARTNINQWVEEKTHNKIKDLIAPGSLSDASLLVVVNAIYFKGGWRKPFDENNTVVEPFHLSSTSSVNVSMMHQTEYLGYTEIRELNLKALKLRYRSLVEDQWADSMSMVILLPNAIDGLPQLESRIASVNITNITQQMSLRDVIVSLPRFKIEKTLKLQDTLKELGITKVFQDGADLSGITDENIVISKVVQKAFVEVTEKGTEAAAATYLEMRFFSSRPPQHFNANHPFLFYILDDVSGTILFMGRVAHPN